MKNQELIKELKKFNDDAEVVIFMATGRFFGLDGTEAPINSVYPEPPGPGPKVWLHGYPAP